MTHVDNNTMTMVGMWDKKNNEGTKNLRVWPRVYKLEESIAMGWREKEGQGERDTNPKHTTR